jgi:hypothetical protein
MFLCVSDSILSGRNILHLPKSGQFYMIFLVVHGNMSVDNFLLIMRKGNRTSFISEPSLERHYYMYIIVH